MPIVQLATLRIRAAIPPSFILGERLDKKTSTVITRIMGMTKEARMPVSYTHLDVYKRQPRARGLRADL